ncbi:hypothetical protein A4X06_0g6424 [Tilletia controversa]|uniref:Uncharacterized protein n=1 Tax=Tilletia controversa TaxID=13291 RepID=A0A8X7SUZ9_9BASI|nr:hypothetical protein CF335_g6228 [Tilletia laevis]KAE8243286.1 hypothetical protein A4X06_0g6424 [Tilletia controversa]
MADTAEATTDTLFPLTASSPEHVTHVYGISSHVPFLNHDPQSKQPPLLPSSPRSLQQYQHDLHHPHQDASHVRTYRPDATRGAVWGWTVDVVDLGA